MVAQRGRTHLPESGDLNANRLARLLIPGLVALAAACAALPSPAGAQQNAACPGPTARDPSWSPDGSRIVFTSNRSGHYNIWSVVIATRETHRLTDTADNGYYPVFSPDGRRVAFTSMASAGQRVAVVDASGGQVTGITDTADNAADPGWLPDGRLVFSSERNGARDLWMANADGTDARRLFALDGDEWAPRISPAGDRILFHNNRSGDFDVYSARLDGTDLRVVAGGVGFDGVASWSPDGALVAYYHRASPEAGNAGSQRSTWATAEIMVVPASGGESRPLTKNDVRDQSPTWSPDGRTIAWTSCASGNLEVWLMDADGQNARQLTQTPRAGASPPMRRTAAEQRPGGGPHDRPPADIK